MNDHPLQQLRAMIKVRGDHTILANKLRLSVNQLSNIMAERAPIPKHVLKRLGWRRVRDGWRYERVS